MNLETHWKVGSREYAEKRPFANILCTEGASLLQFAIKPLDINKYLFTLENLIEKTSTHELVGNFIA